ncbi:MAG: glycosyltransferase family 2 protein [Verrucomicrobia bacterium]|nr:glycosyltransferase family 2 protein [Verrucomicrobiota bacterium]
MNVSLIIPVFNEEDNIPVLTQELMAVHDALPGFETVFVDDGSSDGTWSRIEDTARQHAFIRGVRTEANCGQTSAMLRGLRAARGDILVTMDGDLQNNPADIPRLVSELADCDVVCGYRANRKDTWSRRIASRMANCVRNSVTRDGIRDTGCSLKAFKKECLPDLPSLNGAHRFMPAYFRLHGRRIKEIPVDHRARRHGTSKYTNMKRLPKTVADLLGFRWYRQRYLASLKAESDKLTS